MIPQDKRMSEAEPPPPLKEAPRFESLKKAFGSGELRYLAQASAIGFTFVVAIVMGLAFGWWLDKKINSSPWGILGGLAIGIAAGFKNLFTFSTQMKGLDKKKDD